MTSAKYIDACSLFSMMTYLNLIIFEAPKENLSCIKEEHSKPIFLLIRISFSHVNTIFVSK